MNEEIATVDQPVFEEVYPLYAFAPLVTLGLLLGQKLRNGSKGRPAAPAHGAINTA